MTYAVASALQIALYQHLRADAPLAALVGDAIYDALPAGTLPDLFVTLGPETVKDRSDQTGRGASHMLIVSVVSQTSGFLQAKQAAAAITDALDDADLTLGRGHLVGLYFEKAAARKSGPAGTLRQIDLTFRARVDDTQP